MISTDLLKKIRKIEIKTRRIVQSAFSGGYHSVFKGRGINFAEVRDYQPGDDVRFIDWNVTAKAGKPYIKVYDEERELNVLLMVDISASGLFGSQSQQKLEVIAEIAAVLGFSAISNNDKVGLLLFSDEVERYVPPKKGKQHILRLLRDIFHFKPQHRGTSISNAMAYALRLLKKKSIIFLISDFLDSNYDQLLKIAAYKHDIVPIQVLDNREKMLSKSGRIFLQDAETDDVILINTRSLDVHKKFKNISYLREQELQRFFQSIAIAPIKITVGDSYVEPLMTFFRTRSGRK